MKRSKAVSYTHLDVYKRQLYTIAGYGMIFLFIFSGVEKVLQIQNTKVENAKPDDYEGN